MPLTAKDATHRDGSAVCSYHSGRKRKLVFKILVTKKFSSLEFCSDCGLFKAELVGGGNCSKNIPNTWISREAAK